MKCIKGLAFSIISFAVSVWFFDTSILAMIICFCWLEMISGLFSKNIPDWKKTLKYKVCLGICILGAITIALGVKCFDNDLITIVGIILFSTTFAGIAVKDFVAYSER